ncbi:hypothetical protein TSUD_47560 [Trifolium subterraneum]|nr:hypothetical protein TSUD_47560 [Trifolium subterraneum]
MLKFMFGCYSFLSGWGSLLPLGTPLRLYQTYRELKEEFNPNIVHWLSTQILLVLPLASLSQDPLAWCKNFINL